nr:uncharacterized protein LOC110563134 [Meriones unguiculatus]
MRLCTWPLQALGVLPGFSWLQAKAVELRACTASPSPLPSAPGPPSCAGDWLGGARSSARPHPPGRLFLGLLRATGRWLFPLASRPALSSSPAPALLRHAFELPHRDLRLLAFGSSVARSPAPLQPRALRCPGDCSSNFHSPATAFLPFSPSVCQSICLSSPPAFSFLCPASRTCLLGRRSGAVSQENPRNLCKKLTMKFKKFCDFGAIFEWRA